MIKLPVETPTATLRYALAPDLSGTEAIEATFAAYDRMMAILAEVAPVGANLVSLHAQAYEKIRKETGLPARLVTLGLRDRANYIAAAAVRRIPLDDKLFAIKGPTSLTISTVSGRVLVPFDVPGYVSGWESPFPAHLISDGRGYEIHIAVKSKSAPPEEKTMLHEGILARMGRLLAAIASQTIDNVENNNKVALVKQAIREIDAGADEARYALGKSRAEEFRLKKRREELDIETTGLNEKIRLALAENREDLARAGVARQIDLESQVIALERAMDFIELEIDEQTKALQAMLGARREADTRLADLEQSLIREAQDETSRGLSTTNTLSAERAMAAIARVTGVPAASVLGDKELDELDRLHREKEIAARLERIKSEK
ncbi:MULTISPECIES: PspA/IM30 family protein [Bradyrhizobium]|uniref:PspA/IM30 family protein n=1 Tax=Bradyrhizobium elkanii TaxID=29448 RepID=UPI0027146518|nr:PspA/IM30 family protein [Bradyrhizobium elkanii]WLA52090.1 PspA/IM30 family protein [Bradyrhizobium elkanii]WLB77578.1 PspA/IM30 family protein [Bradyrhizobium elkanii]